MEIGGVNILVAFLAGLVSCISPCVLPLAPVYLSSLASGTVTQGGTMALNQRAPLLHGIAFMTGFLALFTALGVSVGLVGYVLRDAAPLLTKLGGIVLIAMGLHMSRIIVLPRLDRAIGISWDARLKPGYVRSFAAGFFISAGWIPCIGPTLGAILTLAVTSGTALQSGVLLTVYALGLAVPFVGIGLTLSRTPTLLRRMQQHDAAIRFVAGIVMIGMGILLYTDTLTRLNQYFNFAGWGPASKV